MIVVFDLDDVLYEEKTFFQSGLNAITNFIYEEYKIPKKQISTFLKGRQKKEREKIIDDTLRHFNLYSKTRVKKCLTVYRKHFPKINLSSDAKICLKNLKNFTCYIVTDGNKIVQLNKIKSLKLDLHMKKCFLTSNFGLKNAKPSPYCFLKICELEGVEPKQVVYIGDDPKKDFVGIKPLGFHTIRLMKGRYKNVNRGKKFESEIRIKSLKVLNPKFLKKIQNL